jgi:hypothetical protein
VQRKDSYGLNEYTHSTSSKSRQRVAPQESSNMAVTPYEIPEATGPVANNTAFSIISGIFTILRSKLGGAAEY